MEAPRPDVSPGVIQAANLPLPTVIQTPLVGPGSPSPLSTAKQILVVVTADAERYTSVNLTDALNEGSIIRKRILNKLGILDDEDQTQPLIFETEIGALAIGPPLTDKSLSELCRERGDNKASLAFLVERSSVRPATECDITSSPISPLQEQTQSSSAISSSNGDDLPPMPYRAPRPKDIAVETLGNINMSELQPRRVRPLPAIPTPTLAPNTGDSMGSDPYSTIQALASEFNDLCAYAAKTQDERPIESKVSIDPYPEQ